MGVKLEDNWFKGRLEPKRTMRELVVTEPVEALSQY